MKRKLILALCLFVPLGATGVFAASVEDEIIDGLKAQGYSDIQVSTTWLGRVQIEATSPSAHREIVLDPRTGEILRDYWQLLPGAATANANSVVSSSDTDGTNSGSSDDDGSGDENSGSDDGGGDDGGSDGGSDGGGSDDGGGDGSDG